MTDSAIPTSPAEPAHERSLPAKPPKRRRWLRRIGWLVLLLAVVLGIARLAMPSTLRWYVNRTISRSPLYQGTIDSIDVHLYRGAYSIEGIKLIKTTGNVPVPFFSADRLDLSIEWGALLHGRVVGRVRVDNPEINFVDADEKGDSQTGGSDSAPWLGVIRDLFPFQINSARVINGSVHFRTYKKEEKGAAPVDIYLSEISAKLDNLTNIRDEVTPLITTVELSALAMDQAKLECNVSLDPFSFNPTFELRMRLLNLDVTKLNDFSRQYGNFDFEHGWFDLVVEVNAKEGALEGYVKPLFRNLRVLGGQDFKEDNVLDLFWEGIVGATTEVFKNRQREQLGTQIPITGNLSGPKPNVVVTVGNLLRNAFIRAYLPKLQDAGELDGVSFGEPGIFDQGSSSGQSSGSTSTTAAEKK